MTRYAFQFTTGDRFRHGTYFYDYRRTNEVAVDSPADALLFDSPEAATEWCNELASHLWSWGAQIVEVEILDGSER